MKNLTLVSHPLIDHALSFLRAKDTTIDLFRAHSLIVSQLLFIEATKSLPVSRRTITTPIKKTSSKVIEASMVIIPVLRSGLAMLHAIQTMYPQVTVGCVGLERDEETAIPHAYYAKFPTITSKSHVFIVDPMLATGGSMDDAISAVKCLGAKNIVGVSIVSAPEGIARVRKRHPEVHLYTAAVDSHLNEKKFIVPGLGDFGDRYFGT